MLMCLLRLFCSSDWEGISVGCVGTAKAAGRKWLNFILQQRRLANALHPIMPSSVPGPRLTLTGNFRKKIIHFEPPHNLFFCVAQGTVSIGRLRTPMILGLSLGIGATTRSSIC